LSPFPTPPLALQADDDDLTPWLAPRWIVGVGAAVALALTVFALGFLNYERQEQRNQALQRASLYARVLTDQVDRSFDAVQVTLRTLADSLESGESAQNATQRLNQALMGVAFLRSLHVVDSDGLVLASTQASATGWSVPPALLGSPPTVGRWRAAGLLAGRDLKDAHAVGAEPPKRGVLPVVFTMRGGDEFGGSHRLVALVNPDHFATHFDLLLKDTGLQAALLQLDLRVLAGSEAMGVPMGVLPADAAGLAPQLKDQAFDHSVGPGLAGAPSVRAHRHARQAPWVVVVEEPLAQAEAAFQTLALETLVAWALAMGVVMGACVLAFQSARAHRVEAAARAAARRELARQDVLTANLIDASATALYAMDAHGRLLLANQAWGRLVSAEPAQWIGQALPPALQWADPTSLEAADAERLARGDLVTFEVSLPSATGPRDMLVSKVAVRDEAGEPLAVVGSLTDVSVYRDAERRSREAADAARQANDAKSEFIANISHELRTPLQSILGFSEIGQMRCTESPAAQGYFRRVHDAGKHMLSLVEDLLDLAKPELTAAQMTLEALPIGALAAEVLDELSAQALRKQIRVQQHGLAGGVLARVERRGFQQVVRNLVANALRFAPQGSAVEVTLQRAEDGVVRLTVSDRGPGVPPAELEAIFAPFVQSSVTKTHAGGTGLGLAICRRLVQAFGGRVWAETRLGGGAVFVVELPHA
jgi:signal transduction histidine kinase